MCSRSKSRDNSAGSQVRAELGIPEATKLLVFMYGGQPPGDWELQADSLPPGWLCIVCSGGKLPGGKPLPYNFMLADKDAYTPDLVQSLPSGIDRLSVTCT